MKYITILVILLFTLNCKAQKFFQYDYPYKVWIGQQGFDAMIDKSHKQILDLHSLMEMIDSANKYKYLNSCSKKCAKYDSARYYYNRAIYFINQSEWYCAIVYGVDSVKPILYYKGGEPRLKTECVCDP